MVFVGRWPLSGVRGWEMFRSTGSLGLGEEVET